MSQLLRIGSDGVAYLEGEAAAATSAEARTPPNEGRGDARSTIKPNVKEVADLSDRAYEGGRFDTLEEWLARDPAERPSAVALLPRDDARRLAGLADALELIAVDFPTVADGRGLSQAVVLRTQIGFAGELRAIGVVVRDRIFAMAQCGFTAFALRPDQDGQACLAALKDFSTLYAATAAEPQPLFRRLRLGGAS
jgi:uncharacterized protein (DUF934 family)